MHLRLIILSVAVFFVQNGFARLTPDYIHPCKPDNKTCLIQSTIDALPEFSKGIPELGVPSMDPFYIEKLSVPLPGLKSSFYNGKVTGFRKAKIVNVESRWNKMQFIMEYLSNITLKGSYEATGRILAFPINGDGDLKIKITNLKMKIILNMQILPDDKGVEHLSVKNYKYNFDYGDKITYNMTNLFKNNPELSNTVLTFMNENWRLLAEEFGAPVLEASTELAVRTIEKFFLAVPYQELFDGPLPAVQD